MAERRDPRQDDHIGSEGDPPHGDHSGGTASPPQPSSERPSLPDDVLVDALARSRQIGALDGASVPSWLMVEPVALSLDWLEIHGKSCRHPRQCSHVPGPLRPMLKMRRVATTQYQQQVHMALWGYPSSPMVGIVRAEVAKRHKPLVDDIESAALFEPDALSAVLDELDISRAQDLAACLWSSSFEDPRSAELFRLLPALVLPPDPSTPVPLTQAHEPVSEPVEKPRHRDKRLVLERTVSELEAELSQTKHHRRVRAEQLAEAKRELDTTKADLEAAGHRISELNEELASAVAKGRSAETQLRDVERQLKQASTVNDAYRQDLQRAQTELAQTDQERSMSVGRLAEAQARIQEFGAQLRAIPRDTDAIADWLQREETRLQELEYTVEGGTRERVAEEKRLRRKLELAFLDAYPQFQQGRPASVDATRSLTFRALGGGNEVGRSAYLISIGVHDVLIDCGIAVGSRQRDDKVPDLSPVTRLDALLVTHAHTDHLGWIPALVASIEYFPIYCTRPTAQLLPVMLRDSRNHYVRSLAQEQLERKYDPTAVAVDEAYGSEDVVETEGRLLEARVGETEGVGATDLTATFFPAGHILGAASVLLEGGGRRVVISGDISDAHQHTVGPFKVPDGLSGVDLLVLESTYGDRTRPPASVAEAELVSFVSQTTSRGIALLPCFALGRAQEVLAILNSARRAGHLPSDLKIVVDGMINKINPIYVEQAKLEPGDFVEVGGQLDRELAIRAAVSEMTPTVVVATSGMLTGGPVIEWARRLLPDPRHRMALLGYQDEGAPGGLLRKLARDRPPYPVTLFDEAGKPIEVTVASSVASIGLSAHADQDGLVKYAAAVRPKRIVLVHGDDGARSTLRERLIRDGVCEDVVLDEILHVP
jgi:Cft2 family RNA processing exonuclease